MFTGHNGVATYAFVNYKTYSLTILERQKALFMPISVKHGVYYSKTKCHREIVANSKPEHWIRRHESINDRLI